MPFIQRLCKCSFPLGMVLCLCSVVAYAYACAQTFAPGEVPILTLSSSFIASSLHVGWFTLATESEAESESEAQGV